MNAFRRLIFQFWYLGQPPWDTGISPPELMDFIQSHPPGRALDIGCGTGTNVITLARSGWQVSGVDFAGRAIAKARRKAQQAGVQADLRVADATRLEILQPPYDLALDMGCYHNLSSQGQRAYLRHLHRLLAPGGTFLLYVLLKAGDSGMGASESALQAVSQALQLQWRNNSTDRGRRPSAWLCFQKPAAA